MISFPLLHSFNLEGFLLDFNTAIENIFMNDILTCSPDDDSETIDEDSDDDSETIHGDSDDESEAILPENPLSSSLIVEVSIQQDERLLAWSERNKDWHEEGGRYVKRYDTDDVTITTDSTKYYPNQTVEVKDNKNGATDFCSEVTVIKPSNANMEVIEGERHIAETDRDVVQFKATITGDTATIEERGGNIERFQASKMWIECDKNSCDISDRQIDRGKSYEFSSPN